MGSVISNAANGAGTVIGNAFLAPFKSAFGGSCEDKCLGTLDLTCFIEHICITKLVRLFMVAGLWFIMLLIFYLIIKVGIFQCIGKSLCKMGWAGCEMYWCALHDITCFLWHKLANTKRVYRGRRGRKRRLRDIEVGYTSSDDDDDDDEECESSDNYRDRKRKKPSVRDRRKHHHLESSLHSLRRESNYGTHGHHHVHYGNHGHHARSKTRDVSVHEKGESSSLGPSKYSRQLSIRKANNLPKGAKVFKKQGIRR